MTAVGANRRLDDGQSMSALPGHLRHQPVPLLPRRHRPAEIPDRAFDLGMPEQELDGSSKCRLLRVDRKWLNDATGRQAFETVSRAAGRRQRIFGHKEVRYGDNSYPSRS